MTDKTEQMRAEFEAFVRENLGDVPVMDGGRYISPKINSYWLLWSAATLSQQQRIEELEKVCFQVYQVVGSLLSDLGIFGEPQADKILDNLSQARLVHDDILPWEPTPVGRRVAQLESAIHELVVATNTVSYCYTGNFAAALRNLGESAEQAHAVLNNPTLQSQPETK